MSVSRRFCWREGARARGDPQLIGEELERIREKNGGNLRTEDAVEEARREDSPLHDSLTWDDAVAAHQHRLHEMREVIRCVVVVTSSPERETVKPAYVHVTTKEDGPYYSTPAVVFSVEETRQRAIMEALSLLNGIRRKYAHLQELASIFEAISEASEAYSELM